MSGVLSVDLACCAKNVGLCLLRTDESIVSPQFLPCSALYGADPFEPQELASRLLAFCDKEAVEVLIIDGPQAWKDPDSTLLHSRACEKDLATPAKTGPRGIVKPRTWTRFVQFSIDLFNCLTESGASLANSAELIPSPSNLLALESFPTSAWRSLGLKPLPGKQKSKKYDITERTDFLRWRFGLKISSYPSHDELQALVASLAGWAVVSKACPGSYQLHGVPPTIKNKCWVEGFIVNPILVCGSGEKAV